MQTYTTSFHRQINLSSGSPCSMKLKQRQFEHNLFTIGGHPRSAFFKLISVDISDKIILVCEGLSCVF